MDPTSIYTVKAIVLLDSDGKRIFSKYYSNDFPSTKEQQTFEKNLFDKTKKQTGGEIVMFDGLVTVYKNNIDVFAYVIGSASENELILAGVLTTFIEALNIVLRNQMEKRVILENYDALVLAVDELVDGGIILESDPSQIASRVSMSSAEGDQSSSSTPISEESLSKAWSTALSIGKSLLK